MAQEAAHFLGKEEVAGSNPAISSRNSRVIAREFYFLYNYPGDSNAEYFEIKIF